jgi:hypothetical protein
VRDAHCISVEEEGNMSDVKGNVSRGKGKEKVTVRIKGKATRSQWAELQQKLERTVKSYAGLSIDVSLEKKKPRPKKAKKSRKAAGR